MPISSALLAARKVKGWSIDKLSAASGVDAATIWRIEAGKTDPRFETQLLPLVNALGQKLPAFLKTLT